MRNALTKGFLLSALLILGGLGSGAAQAEEVQAAEAPPAAKSKAVVIAERSARASIGVWKSSMRLGDTLFEKGHFDEAASAYRLALVHSPGGEDLANNLYRLATTLIEQQKYEEALPHLEKALELVAQVRNTESLYYAALEGYVFASIKAGREQHVAAHAMELLAIKSGKPSPWFTQGVDRRLTHRPTGIVFPLEQAGLLRTAETTLDAKAGEVSVPYFLDAASGRLAVAVYLLPVGGDSAEDHFKASLNAALDRLPDARRLSVGFQRVAHAKGEAAGHHSLFSYQDTASETDFLGQLYVFQAEDTIIKFRFSYPSVMTDIATEQIPAFLQEFDWPIANRPAK